MRNLSDTIQRLARYRAPHPIPADKGGVDRLRDFPEFGSNPGALRARIYIPRTLGRDAPLVVALHGCTQTAAGYDHGAGWSQLADRQGFAVLLPEQQRANNANLCFNWFAPDDIARDGGEALSIRQMIDAVVATYRLDRDRVFITGLSAGGAMSAAMLAACPELFAGGAIIAGLPYGCAATVPEAFDRMRGHGLPDATSLQRRLREASPHQGPWPTISIWHGAADRTVDSTNAEAIVNQWRAVHGVADAPSETELVDGHQRRAWRDADGRLRIESYSIAGMGHGAPLATRGANGVGASGPFMIEAGISSTLHSARAWGILPGAARQNATPAPAHVPAPAAIDSPQPATRASASNGQPANREARAPAQPANSVRKIIEDALRAAGLMRT